MRIILKFGDLAIPFGIHGHSIALKWLALVQLYKDDANFALEKEIRGPKAGSDERKLRQSIYATYKALRGYSSDAFDFQISPDRRFTQDELNRLHEEFERLSVDKSFFPKDKSESFNVRVALEQLNRDIHQYEVLGPGGNEAIRPGLSTRVDYHFVEKLSKVPNVLKVPIEDSELVHFSRIRRPGTLLLRYCISGKHVREAFLSGQTVHEAHPQRHISPSFMYAITAAPRAFQDEQWKRIDEWLAVSGFDSQSPFLCLGWVELASVEEPDRFALSDAELSKILKLSPEIMLDLNSAEEANLNETSKSILKNSAAFDGREARRVSRESLMRAEVKKRGGLSDLF